VTVCHLHLKDRICELGIPWNPKQNILAGRNRCTCTNLYRIKLSATYLNFNSDRMSIIQSECQFYGVSEILTRREGII